jgi:hypothetical protein
MGFLRTGHYPIDSWYLYQVLGKVLFFIEVPAVKRSTVSKWPFNFVLLSIKVKWGAVLDSCFPSSEKEHIVA